MLVRLVGCLLAACEMFPDADSMLAIIPAIVFAKPRNGEIGQLASDYELEAIHSAFCLFGGKDLSMIYPKKKSTMKHFGMVRGFWSVWGIDEFGFNVLTIDVK